MRLTHVLFGALAGSASLALAVACTTYAQGALAADNVNVERGKYLVTVGGCNDCHTPLKMGAAGPEPDFSRMLSGHPEAAPITEATPIPAGSLATIAQTGTAFSGPWGVSFAANLTPDTNTGIGIWTEEMFIKTIRTGRHWGVSRPILPPMPWFNYREMTDEDLKAVYAFLRTIKPIANHVPEPLPPATVTTH
jgi:mono/diheme cytochrome c family protein